MSKLSFRYFPKSWGIYLPYNGKAWPLRPVDLDVLAELKKRLEHKWGEPVSFKWDIKPLKIAHVESSLRRLWANNLIFKFAKQMHTQSGRPEYIKWYIWGDYEQNTAEGGSSTAPIYISER